MLERLSLPVYFAELRIAEYLLLEVGGKSVGQPFLVEFLQALKILDVALVTFFVTESRLAVDRGTIRDVALTENSRVGLCEVLGTLDGSMSF